MKIPRTLAAVVVSLLLWPGVTFASAAFLNQESGIRRQLPPPAGMWEQRVPVPERIDPDLLARASYGEIRVVVELDTLGEPYLPALASHGLAIETWAKNLVQGLASRADLEELARLPYVIMIREPASPVLAAVTSEGVSAIGADLAQTAGLRGAGVRVAVIDAGFDTTNAEIAANVKEARSFRADGDLRTADARHGTAVAELILDVAPAADLYLYNIATDVEFINAVEYAVRQRVNIISISLGFFNVGPYDGTSTVSQALNDARANGVLPVVAVGNEAERHWSGVFADPDSDRWHNFAGADETNGVEFRAGQRVTVYLSWNAWPVTNQDYDLYLFDPSLNVVASSLRRQTGSQAPTERLSFTAPTNGTYHIAVANFSATRPVAFHLYVLDATPEHAVAAGSIPAVGDARGAVAVGAFNWADGQLESFSSRGPTDDGRIKPDIVAPDRVSTSSYGPRGFAGTSAAAPHATGVAALLLSGNRGLTASDLQTLLEKAAVDAGAVGKDNEYGAGRVRAKFVTIDVTPRVSPLLVDGQRFETAMLPAVFVWADGSTHAIEILQRLVGNDTTRFRFTAWSDGPSVPSRTITFAVTAGSLVAQFTTQYRVRVLSTLGTASGADWYDRGARATISISPTLLDHQNRTRSVFRGWTGALHAPTPSVELLVDAPKTLVATWVRQYLVALLSAYGAPQGAGWHDQGTLLQIRVESMVDHGNQTRRLFTGWTGDAQSSEPVVSISVDRPKTLQADWKTQYFVRIASPYGSPRGEGWHNRGQQITVSVTSPVEHGNQTRRVFTAWSGGLSGQNTSFVLQVTRPITAIAEWKTQYFLQLVSAYPLDGAGWHDRGTTVTLRASPIIDHGNATRRIFLGWAGDAVSKEPEVTLVINAPRRVQATWETEYFIRVVSPYSRALGEGWHRRGTTVPLNLEQLTVDFQNLTRRVFLRWTGAIESQEAAIRLFVDAPKQVQAEWKTQYFVQVRSAYGTPSGAGWYDTGAQTTIAVEPLIDPGNGTRRVLQRWAGVEQTAARFQLVVTAPVQLEAQWQTQYLVTFTFSDQSGVAVRSLAVSVQLNNGTAVTLRDPFRFWLPEGMAFRLGTVEYGQLDVGPPDGMAFAATGPVERRIPLRIYDATIRVSDPLGSAIGGAEVTATLANGTRAQGMTDSRGLFRLSQIPLGTFSLQVSHLGASVQSRVATPQAETQVTLPVSLPVLGALAGVAALATLLAFRRKLFGL